MHWRQPLIRLPLEHCHVCGFQHPLAVTPWPFLPTGETDTFFCPYDMDGLAKVVLPGRGIYTASTAPTYFRRIELLRDRLVDGYASGEII